MVGKSMSTTTLFTCDGCGQRIQGAHKLANNKFYRGLFLIEKGWIEKSAKQKGTNRKGLKHYCPECVQIGDF